MKFTKQIQGVAVFAAALLFLSGCVTVKDGGRGRTTFGPDLSFGAPNRVLHEAKSPLGKVQLKKELLGNKHWVDVTTQTFDMEFPEDVRSVTFVRDFGNANRESLLVYRYTADSCPNGYKFLAVDKEKMYSADMGDCIRELDYRTNRDYFLASVLPDRGLTTGYQWTYTRGKPAGVARMTVAELKPSSPAPRPSTSPRQSTPTYASTGGGSRTTASSQPSHRPAPVPGHRRLPTGGIALPSEVDVAKEEGHSTPVVVLN